MRFLYSVKCPASIFIAQSDRIIPFASAINFKKHLTNTTTLTIAKHAGHKNLVGNKAVEERLNKLLGSLNELQ